jgi:hypothetical protein
MSSRPLLKPQKVVVDQAANADFVSPVTTINMISIVSYNVSWGAGVTGTFSVEGCNDYVNPVGIQNSQVASGSWVALPLSSPTSATGPAGYGFLNVSAIGCAYIRLRFTDTSGGTNTGKVNATVSGKVA